MNINPTLTALENILALATDPAFTAPTNPEDLAVGSPINYDPNATVATGLTVFGTGVDVDGVNNNTEIVVFVRPSLEDVSEDGVTQLIRYQRKTLTQILGSSSSTVNVASLTTSQQLIAAVASVYGLVESELILSGPFTAQSTSIGLEVIPNSILYAASEIQLTLTR